LQIFITNAPKMIVLVEVKICYYSFQFPKHWISICPSVFVLLCNMASYSEKSMYITLTHSLTHEAEPFLRSCQLCSYSRTS
jgi:hypothetical protein